MEKMKYKKVTITLPEKLDKEFSNFCKKNGMNKSSRIATLIQKDLQKSD